ncbi:MAG: hypothetical protein H6998_12050 [Hahellaceae bacterium]|jgi:hypothetical protein|nr:hypothetical protein [Hahellaceae bacterium]
MLQHTIVSMLASLPAIEMADGVVYNAVYIRLYDGSFYRLAVLFVTPIALVT